MGEQTEEEKKKKFALKLRNTYLAGLFSLIIAVVIISILYGLNIGSQISSVTVSGVSIFAVFYLLAQFDERIVEAFANWDVFGYNPYQSNGNGGQAAAAKQAGGKKTAAKKTGDPPEEEDPDADAKDKETNKQKKTQNDSLKHARVVSVWCLASAIGILMCYVTVGLLKTIGVTFTFSTIGGHYWDAIISGILVGGGTKPLHDLINLFDNSSSSKSSS